MVDDRLISLLLDEKPLAQRVSSCSTSVLLLNRDLEVEAAPEDSIVLNTGCATAILTFYLCRGHQFHSIDAVQMIRTSSWAKEKRAVDRSC